MANGLFFEESEGRRGAWDLGQIEGAVGRSSGTVALLSPMWLLPSCLTELTEQAG